MDDSTLWGSWMPYAAAAVVGVVLFLLLRRLFRRKPPESRYVEALSALLEGDEEKALADLRQTVRVEQSNIDAYLRLGNLLRKKGMTDRALRIHRDLDVGTFFRRKLTPREKFRIREAIADDLLASRRGDEALAVLAELLKQEKTNRKIRSKMVALYERRGDWENAFRLYREGYKARKEEAPERIARYRAFCGTELLTAGDREEAAKVIRDALRIDPSCPEALYRLGEMRFEDEELDEAVSYWKRFHESVPHLASITYEKMEGALYETGDLNRVESIYRAVLEKEPNEEGTLIALSTFYTRRGQAEEAIDLARRAAEKHLESTEAQDHYLRLLSETGAEDGTPGAIREHLRKRRRRSLTFTCDRCRHPSKEPFWRCPKCLDWNTAVPHRRIETAPRDQSPSG